MKVSAVVFDLGGVYFSDGTKKVIDFLNKNYSISMPILQDIYYGDKSWDLRINKISSYDYWTYVYKKYPHLNNIDFKYLWYDSFTIDYKIHHMVKSLSKKYYLGIISGNISDRVDYLEKKYCFKHLFDFQLYSFSTGLHKIDKRLYTLASTQLKVMKIPTYETIFLDDNEDCVKIASEVGMYSILYKNDFKKLSQQLRELGVDVSAEYEDIAKFKNIDYSYLKIKEYDNWDLYLHDNQSYLGRMYLVARSDNDRDFSDITDVEMKEFLSISKKIKIVLYTLFQPDLINYSSLCNVYRKLHVHFVPRYKSKRYFHEVEFTDKRWGMNYSPYDQKHFINGGCLLAIKETIKNALLRG